ncbi:MAG: DsbE family thiol:disulfide interchange protein [Neomegalonema sp.]|nr:DsbE family thiol:disulfide interchange protein [Neomegalonema sp.]
MKLKALIPLALIAALLALFAVQLMSGRGSTLPSALLNRPVPEFTLPKLDAAQETVSNTDLADGRVTVLNMWASWCGPCRVEHPELIRLKELAPDVRLIGYNYKDTQVKARQFLSQLGDPFDDIIVDASGSDALRWGVTGVPETYVINGQGRIIYKHTGPLNRAIISNPCQGSLDGVLRGLGMSDCEYPVNDLEEILLPVIEKARQG